MRVDEPREQRRVVEVDRAGARGHADRRRRADGDDLVVGDDHHPVLNRCRAGAVDHPGGLEDDGAGPLQRIRRRLGERERRGREGCEQERAHCRVGMGSRDVSPAETGSRRVHGARAIQLPRRPNVTLTVMRSAPRTMTTSTTSPGFCAYNAFEYVCRSFTGLPANSTMTSPGLSPAFSAGLSARTADNRTPVTSVAPMSGTDPR